MPSSARHAPGMAARFAIAFRSLRDGGRVRWRDPPSDSRQLFALLRRRRAGDTALGASFRDSIHRSSATANRFDADMLILQKAFSRSLILSIQITVGAA